MTLIPAPLEINDNDVCTKAAPIAVDSPGIVGNNITLATSDEKEVLDDCSCDNVTNRGSRGLWYSFYGTGGMVWINVCEGRIPSLRLGLDVSVYKGSCGPSSLQCVAGSPLEAMCTQKLMFNTEAGTEYHVLVQNRDVWGFNSGLFDIAISSVTSLPSNDVCSTAEPASIGGTIVGDAAFATNDKFEIGTLCDPTYPKLDTYPGLWYTFQGTGASVKVSSPCRTDCSKTEILIFKGSCGPSTIECVSGSTINCFEPERNPFEFATDAGSTYFMLILKNLDPQFQSTFEVNLESIPLCPFVQLPSFPVNPEEQCLINDPPTILPTAPPSTRLLLCRLLFPPRLLCQHLLRQLLLLLHPKRQPLSLQRHLCQRLLHQRPSHQHLLLQRP